jgi:hypothetical protein
MGQSPRNLAPYLLLGPVGVFVAKSAMEFGNASKFPPEQMISSGKEKSTTADNADCADVDAALFHPRHPRHPRFISFPWLMRRPLAVTLFVRPGFPPSVA